ncbi:MAG TPA: hypothetical protein VND93_01325 [Myxococcales bacterium]|nr:hypothetical protein [Myxococcales bacterium]
MRSAAPFQLLAQEAQALLSRIGRLRPFALRIQSVAAAAISPAALRAIELDVDASRRELARRAVGFLRWLADARERGETAEAAQRRLTVLRLRFNATLNEIDLFDDALLQRSEHELGTWLGGLDAVAQDALELDGAPFTLPPLLCYVDRGLGGAVRRARTRLPGGRPNPVTVIRVPRERLIGSGIASSLVHEAGHQGAALLSLVRSLRPVIRAFAATPSARAAWRLWDRWISEIVADLWAVARVGIAAPLGLLAVVSLPRPFVFRLNADDPHPMPYIRVQLSCALGDALYPHPQWQALSESWKELYPARDLRPEVMDALGALEESLPALSALLVHHRPRSLGGVSLAGALASADRTPERLDALWAGRARALRMAPPTIALAAIGQARARGLVSATRETELVSGLLSSWALRRALQPARRPAVTVYAAEAH